MKREKFIVVQKPTYTQTATGGSTVMFSVFWQGWAQVDEKGYTTGLQSSQFEGNQPVIFNIRKNAISDQINQDYRIDYRGKNYQIAGIREIDRFTIEITAVSKKL